MIERDRALINKALREYLKRAGGPARLRKAMEYAVFSGGKRLRPLLTLESSRALKGSIKKALPFACAIEFVHNFSLVHDDLPSMDNDDMRRGKPTCHKKFGEGLAILAGDGLLNLAFGIISALKYKKTLEAVSVVADTVGSENMLGGQALDLERNNRLTHLGGVYNTPPRCVSKRRASDDVINRMKTASLMAASCKIGALAAGAGKGDAERMRKFGMNLGLAFQLADDMEDSPNESLLSDKMRKKTGFFISEGKKYLAPFGKRADGLAYIADSVLKKTMPQAPGYRLHAKRVKNNGKID